MTDDVNAMTESENHQKLRDGLKSIRVELADLMHMLSTDEVAQGSRQSSQTSMQTECDFFDQITQTSSLSEDNDLYRKVLNIITDLGYASTLVLQTKLDIDYRQALSIVANLERDGLIGPAHGFRPHKILPFAYQVRDRLEHELEVFSNAVDT